MLQAKFKVGQRVRNLKTGHRVTGTIQHVCDPISWLKMSGRKAEEFVAWRVLDPDWDSKPIYIVILDEPKSPLSPAECAELGVSYESLKPEPRLMYPECDLFALAHREVN